jgi:ribosomal protein S3
MQKQGLLNALHDKYEAEISAAHATINIYLNSSVGIGEHPQHIDELDKQLQKIVDAEEKLNVLEDFGDNDGSA